VLTAGVTTLGNLRQAVSIVAAAVALLLAVLSSAVTGTQSQSNGRKLHHVKAAPEAGCPSAHRKRAAPKKQTQCGPRPAGTSAVGSLVVQR
jgi:hypothetical protein